MIISIEHHDGKYPSFNICLSSKEGKDPFLTIKGCQVKQGDKGEFIAYPAKKQESGKWWNHVYATFDFNEAVLKKYHESKPAQSSKAAPVATEDNIPF